MYAYRCDASTAIWATVVRSIFTWRQNVVRGSSSRRKV
ncbi:unnamed protein product [Ectocarpus sp. 13 AM-2016]